MPVVKTGIEVLRQKSEDKPTLRLGLAYGIFIFIFRLQRASYVLGTHIVLIFWLARLVRAARLRGIVVLSLAQGAVGPIVVRQTTVSAAVRPLLFTLALLVKRLLPLSSVVAGAPPCRWNGFRFRFIPRKVPGLSANPLGFRGGEGTMVSARADS